MRIFSDRRGAVIGIVFFIGAIVLAAFLGVVLQYSYEQISQPIFTSGMNLTTEGANSYNLLARMWTSWPVFILAASLLFIAIYMQRKGGE